MTAEVEAGTRRGPGRPPVGKPIPVRMPADLLRQVDSFAAEYGVPRAVMVRAMVRFAAEQAEENGWDVVRP